MPPKPHVKSPSSTIIDCFSETTKPFKYLPERTVFDRVRAVFLTTKCHIPSTHGRATSSSRYLSNSVYVRHAPFAHVLFSTKAATSIASSSSFAADTRAYQQNPYRYHSVVITLARLDNDTDVRRFGYVTQVRRGRSLFV